MRIRLPNGWDPRPYQRPLWDYLEGGGKRAVAIWHRRAGKDDLALHWTAVSVHMRVGTYWHMLPEAAQARKAIWEAVNPHTGKRRIDEAFPRAIRETTREQEMFIRFKSGSTWQVVGSDNFDSLVGSPPIGVVFSEWALADPRSWAYLRPILAENGGWALFITTPRGPNHGMTMFEAANDDSEWFAERLPATKTTVFTPEALERERREYVREYGQHLGEAMYAQEYLCSFDAPMLGAYYAREMALAAEEGRITRLAIDKTKPVDTAWDIGTRDATAIWFSQRIGHEIRLVDYLESSGVGVDWYAAELQKRGYVYGEHILPHDVENMEWGTGRTRLETLRGLGIGRVRVIPQQPVPDGINAVRLLLPRMVFDAEKCQRGVLALRSYRQEWDDKLRNLKPTPLHDWCFTGDTLVLTRSGTHQIRNLPITGEVLTPCGWRRYHSPRVTRRNARLVEVRFAGGFTVRCTPDHLFATASGWRSAESLTTGLQILSSLTPSRSISVAASTVVGRATAIGHAAARNCIAMFGRLRSALFPMAVTSIIGTATRITTGSPISNAFRQASTSLGRGATARPMSPSISVLSPAVARPTGIALKREGSGTSATLSAPRAGLSGSAKSALASIAANCSRLLFGGTSRSSVPKYAKPLLIESVTPLSETADVWCLSVPDGEWFTLANGAVVHNCSHAADAMRYLALAYREPSMQIRQDRYAKKRPGGTGWMAA